MNEIEQLMSMIAEIRKDQKEIMVQQKEIMSVLVEIKDFHRKMRQEFEVEEFGGQFFSARNGFMN